MGIFDFFKPKVLTHEQKVEMAYSCYKQDMVDKLFPQGKVQVSKIIFSLAKIYNLNLENCDAKMYYEILSTYTDVLIRRVVTKSTDKHIITSLQIKHANLGKNEETAKLLITFCTLNMSDNSFALDTNQNCAKFYLINDMYANNEEISKQNAGEEEKFINDPEYGLIPEKPIFTCGVTGSEKYLDKLRLDNGEKIKWERLGSTSADSVNGMIDIYEITTLSGDKCKDIYINMYGNINSTHDSEGFKIEDNFFYF